LLPNWRPIDRVTAQLCLVIGITIFQDSEALSCGSVNLFFLLFGVAGLDDFNGNGRLFGDFLQFFKRALNGGNLLFFRVHYSQCLIGLFCLP
jgi:hypothetical protein